MDAKFVVDAVNDEERPRSTYGDIVAGCRGTLWDNTGWIVTWINPEANVMAHILARVAMDFSSPHYWIERSDFVNCLPDSFCSCMGVMVVFLF
ncbi:hypothetical protein ACS0TY_004688 [Phlomoides rotata]